MSEPTCIFCFDSDPREKLILLHNNFDHHAHSSCIGAWRNFSECPVCKCPLPNDVIKRIKEETPNSAVNVVDKLVACIKAGNYDEVLTVAGENISKEGIHECFRYLLFELSSCYFYTRSIYHCIYYYACCTCNIELVKAVAKYLIFDGDHIDQGYIYLAFRNIDFLTQIVTAGIMPNIFTLKLVLMECRLDLRVKEYTDCLEFHWKYFPKKTKGPAAMIYHHGCKECADIRKYLIKMAFIHRDVRGFINFLKGLRRDWKFGNSQRIC